MLRAIANPRSPTLPPVTAEPVPSRFSPRDPKRVDFAELTTTGPERVGRRRGCRPAPNPILREPASLPHGSYKIVGDWCLGRPGAITLRARLINKEDGLIERAIGGCYERLGRLSVKEAKRVPMRVRLLDGSGQPVRDAGGRPLQWDTTTDRQGRLSLRLTDLGLEPGHYQAELLAPTRSFWGRYVCGCSGHSTQVYPVGWLPVHVLSASARPTLAVLDLDETLIRTDFRSLAGLVRMFTRRPEQIRTIPGMASLAASLSQRGALMALSGSPDGMREDFQKLLSLHHLHVDGGIALKDWGAEIRELREHVGYKVGSLLDRLVDLPVGTSVDLIGDNTEADAVVYSIIRRCLDGSLRGADLADELVARGVRRSEAVEVAARAEGLRPATVRVGSTLIRLSPEGKSAEQVAAVDETLTAIRDGLQGALALVEAGRLPEACLGRVLDGVLAEWAAAPGGTQRAALERLEESLEDAGARQVAGLAPIDFVRRLATLRGASGAPGRVDNPGPNMRRFGRAARKPLDA